MDLDHLLRQLTDELKLENAQQDQEGGYRVQINEHTLISLKAFESGILYSAQIATIPESRNRESLFIHLMSANLLGIGTGGGSIGIDPLEKFFTLSFLLIDTPPYRAFRAQLEDFLNYLDYWREEIPHFLRAYP